MTKLCPNPTCEEVALNCPIEVKKCSNCGARLVSIGDRPLPPKYAAFPHTHVDYSSIDQSGLIDGRISKLKKERNTLDYGKGKIRISEINHEIDALKSLLD